MTYSDYEKGISIIYDIIEGECAGYTFENRYDLTKDLSSLNLNEVECNRLYEYIDRKNTECNMLFAACRNACKKSEQRV